MDIQYAKKLLTILADGIHPITGEVLPPEDSCNHPQVIRALHAVLSEKSDQEKQNASEKKLPENAGSGGKPGNSPVKEPDLPFPEGVLE